ncbi:hypothetical protein [Yinghuangia sp. YIM S09857]|uniref:hypothetical protein n=1 Tax=Yinghuangia sp. YIM S09857 TaxID=3436929 RepID=UPI003F5381B5
MNRHEHAAHTPQTPAAESAQTHAGGHEAGAHSGAHAHGHGAGSHGGGVPGGLQVSERGYTLVPGTEPRHAGEPTDLRFQILGPDGNPWTQYDLSHGRQLHLIVARRDLSGFQHVHPVLDADGTWSVPLTFADAGDHRIFADFAPTGDPQGALTLGADIAVAGDYRPVPLPVPSRTARVDGYTVTLDGDLATGDGGMVTLSVAKDGRPVTDLEPYLGAYGHLVALRQGDLGYLHVHPQGEPGDGVTPAGPGIVFHAAAPSAGAYRLYLDFQHEGMVRTAEFTAVAARPAPRHTPQQHAADHGEHAGHGEHAAHAGHAHHTG